MLKASAVVVSLAVVVVLLSGCPLSTQAVPTIQNVQPLLVDQQPTQGTVGQGQYKWYSFNASSGGSYTVRLQTTAGNADLAVYYQSAENLVSSSTFPGTAHDAVVLSNATGGRYYIGVTSASGSSSYTVAVTSGALESYVGAASYGDLVAYYMDLANNTYSAYNLTTGATVSGTFTLSSDGRRGTMDGVYPFVRLPGEIVVISPRSAGAGHHLVVALKRAYVPFGTEIGGNYLYVGTYGDYGTATATASSASAGTFAFQALNVAEQGSGPYQFNANHSAVHWQATSGTAAGSSAWGVFLSDEVFVVDNYDPSGAPQGMTVGVKRPTSPPPPSALAGTYHYVDKYGGYGDFTINSSGTVDIAGQDASGNPFSASGVPISQTPEGFYQVTLGAEQWTVVALAGTVLVGGASQEAGGPEEGNIIVGVPAP